MGGDAVLRTLAKLAGPFMRPPRVLSTMTVADMFKAGRRRLDLDLVVAVVRAPGVDEHGVDQWRQACIKVHAQPKTGGPAGVIGEVPTAEADDALDQLQDENLIGQHSPGRYALHDLVRAFALETAENTAPAKSPAAVERLARWFLHSAFAAAKTMNHPGLPELAGADDSAPLVFDSYEAALAWFDAEHENLIAVHRAAAEAELYSVTWQLPIVLGQFRNLRFHRTASVEAYRVAVDAARARGDAMVVAWNLRGASASLFNLSRFDEAEAVLAEALSIYRTAQDRRGEGTVLTDLGNHYNSRGRYDDAIEVLTLGMALNEAAGDRRRVMICELNIGVSYYLLDDMDKAQGFFQKALTAARACGERRAECILLGNLGELNLRLDRIESAQRFYSEQRQVAEDTGSLEHQGGSLAGLGNTLHAMGHVDEAVAYWRKAYEILSAIGLPGAGEVHKLIENNAADSTTRARVHPG